MDGLYELLSNYNDKSTRELRNNIKKRNSIERASAERKQASAIIIIFAVQNVLYNVYLHCKHYFWEIKHKNPLKIQYRANRKQAITRIFKTMIIEIFNGCFGH